jgi:hypothetical protein
MIHTLAAEDTGCGGGEGGWPGGDEDREEKNRLS